MQEVQGASQDGNIKLTILPNPERLSFAVTVGKMVVIEPSSIAMKVDGHDLSSGTTLLRGVGTEFRVMQELLRHSSLRSTLDVYRHAISPAKRAAQAVVPALVVASETNSSALA